MKVENYNITEEAMNRLNKQQSFFFSVLLCSLIVFTLLWFFMLWLSTK